MKRNPTTEIGDYVRQSVSRIGDVSTIEEIRVKEGKIFATFTDYHGIKRIEDRVKRPRLARKYKLVHSTSKRELGKIVFNNPNFLN